MIRDISEKSYNKRTFPTMYAQEDFTAGSKLYLKDDEFDTYHFNYGNVVKLIKENKINTQTVIFIKNAALLKS